MKDKSKNILENAFSRRFDCSCRIKGKVDCVIPYRLAYHICTLADLTCCSTPSFDISNVNLLCP